MGSQRHLRVKEGLSFQDGHAGPFGGRAFGTERCASFNVMGMVL